MASSEPISLDLFRKKKKVEEDQKKYPAIMIWLHCPRCNTTEFTEIRAPDGRTHKCGALVREVEVDIDLRAELMITEYNLVEIEQLLEKNKPNRLKKLFAKTFDNALQALLASEKSYMERLLLLAKQPIAPYPGVIGDLKDQLSVAEVNQLGLFISEFRYKPESRFET